MSALAGKRTLVTGASQGIGKAIARALYAQGAALYLVGRDQARLQQAIKAFEDGRGIEPVSLIADLSRADDLDYLTRELAGSRALDILVHSAGQYARGSWSDASLDAFSALLDTNLHAPVRLTIALLPLLEKANGDIVFINSSIVEHTPPRVGHYAVTKHAQRAFADSLRAEVNQKGIRVLSVYPGRTATPLQQAIHAEENKPYEPARLLQPEDVASAVIACLSLPETAEVTDIYVRPRYKT